MPKPKSAQPLTTKTTQRPRRVSSPSFRPDFRLEENLAMPCCGIDEAGRGPLAGPVVAAAVMFDPRDRLPLALRDHINDSKKLSPARRQSLAQAIRDYGQVGIGLCSVAEIDQMNILQATLTAMQRAYHDISGPPPAAALIDGNQRPTLPCHIKTVIKGDSLSLSIAAASIIAKVSRDELMRQLAEEHNVYGWERNAGYGTATHLKAIEIHGVTLHHRRSFAPIAKRLLKINSANN